MNNQETDHEKHICDNGSRVIFYHPNVCRCIFCDLPAEELANLIRNESTDSLTKAIEKGLSE